LQHQPPTPPLAEASITSDSVASPPLAEASITSDSVASPPLAEASIKSDSVAKRAASVLVYMNTGGVESKPTAAPSWQRAVSNATLMDCASRHFGSNKAGEREYALSFPCEEYTHFVSHSWRAPRHLKYVALLFRFSLIPALIAAHAVALTGSVLFALEVLPPVAHLATWGALGSKSSPCAYWAQLLAFPTFCATLVSYHRVRDALERRVSWLRRSAAFLDKLCIHQTDAKLRQLGIDALGVYLQNSRAMLMLWSPEYFTRLWCCFELGVFLKAMDEGEAKRRLEVLPLFSAAQAFWLALMLYLFAWSFNLSVDFLQMDAFAGVVTLLVAISVGLIGAHHVREFCYARTKLEQQTANFSISKAECAVEADRKLVTTVLATLYRADSSPEVPDSSPFELFEELIRTKVTCTVKRSLSSVLPSLRALALIGSAFSLCAYDNVAMMFLISDAEISAARLEETSSCSDGDLIWVRVALYDLVSGDDGGANGREHANLDQCRRCLPATEAHQGGQRHIEFCLCPAVSHHSRGQLPCTAHSFLLVCALLSRPLHRLQQPDHRDSSPRSLRGAYSIPPSSLGSVQTARSRNVQRQSLVRQYGRCAPTLPEISEP